MMRQQHLIVAVLLAASTLGGCTPFQGIASSAMGIPVESKAVNSKQGSNELIAHDGTYCLVSESRFEEVEIGDDVLCDWSTERPASPNSPS